MPRSVRGLLASSRYRVLAAAAPFFLVGLQNSALIPCQASIRANKASRTISNNALFIFRRDGHQQIVDFTKCHCVAFRFRRSLKILPRLSILQSEWECKDTSLIASCFQVHPVASFQQKLLNTVIVSEKHFPKLFST